MEQFSYHFISTMLHSLWQTALLLLFFGILIFLKPRLSPLTKRNILLSLLALQLVYSVATFYLLATNATQGFFILFSHSANQWLAKSWLQDNAYLIFLSYLLFVAARISSISWQWRLFKKRYKKHLLKAPLDLRLFTNASALQFGIRQKVSLWCSNYVQTPMTFGFWKPVILLPLALVNQLSLQQVEALIIHELTHIRQKDYLLNLGLVVTETLFFFNPFVRFIAKQIKMERERNCDVQVLHFKYGYVPYAEALLKVSQMQYQLSLQIPAVKGKDQLFKRISFFTKHENLAFQQSQRSVLLIGYMCTVLLTLLLAGTFTQKKVTRTLPTLVQKNTLAASPIFPNETAPIFQTKAGFTSEKIVSPKKSNPVKTTRDKISAQKENLEELAIFSDEAPVFQAIPASSTETSLEGKEIIIEEERSDGRKITAAYYALLIDGLWTLQPLWLISETRPVADSLKLMNKDSLIKFLPNAQ